MNGEDMNGEEWVSVTRLSLGVNPDAVRGAIVGKVAIRRGETYSGRGLGPSGDRGKHGDGDSLIGSWRHLAKLASDKRSVRASFGRRDEGCKFR